MLSLLWDFARAVPSSRTIILPPHPAFWKYKSCPYSKVQPKHFDPWPEAVPPSSVCVFERGHTISYHSGGIYYTLLWSVVICIFLLSPYLDYEQLCLIQSCITHSTSNGTLNMVSNK